VYERKDVSGEIIYPASYKFGFVVQQEKPGGAGWLIGADYTMNKWDNYRFFGQKDSVKNNWQLNVGGQFHPRPRNNYFSTVTYRFGFFTGPDYIMYEKKLPTFGGSFGMTLPIIPRTTIARNQFSYVNLAFEYSKRGNNDNRLKENMFRVSASFSLTDFWFGKQRYE